MCHLDTCTLPLDGDAPRTRAGRRRSGNSIPTPSDEVRRPTRDDMSEQTAHARAVYVLRGMPSMCMKRTRLDTPISYGSGLNIAHHLRTTELHRSDVRFASHI